MSYKYNPFTNNFDDVGSGGGGGTPGGTNTQVQFNDSGAFGGDAGLVFNKTTNKLTAGGDVELNDGGTFTTTLQTVTATAARTISFPDATGTVALVAGSSGQLLYNASGANAGASTLTYDGSILTSSGRFINSYNASLATPGPAKAFTGTWFATGGTATTTKPQVLIEPTGATSTAWSTSGTGLGVNAASGFAGNLLDLQVNGTSKGKITSTGALLLGVGGSSLIANADGSNSITLGGGGNIYPTAASITIGTPTVAWTGLYLGTGLNSGITGLLSDAANTLAQRNGTNAQTFRVYNTYTSSTNYELGKLEWSSNVFRIGTEKGSGGGTARNLELQYDGTTQITLKSGETLLGAGSSPLLTLGHASADSNARIGFFGGVQLRNSTFNSVSSLVLTNGNLTDVGGLQFGGTSSSFPALKRSSAILQARLADDSAYTTIDAQHRLQGTAPASATATGTAGDIRYDADYIYICTATNTWKRAAISTW